MKNKKGFTLVEIIAAVIILGIISIVAVIAYSGSMEEFRESYYTSLEKTMVEAGREFFSDNRTYRPSSIFESQKVPINLLESKSYVNEILDYNGKKCDKSSYVIAIKNGKNDYVYHACLVCSEDIFTNTEDRYCDGAWEDNTTIQYTLEELDDIYIYKNTSKEKLKEKLNAKISISKFDRTGTVKLASVSGIGIDDVPSILPDNIDIIDTSKVGNYQAKYSYNGATANRTVHVYENSAPTVTIQKKNVYAKSITENTVTEDTQTVALGSNDWAQELIFNFAVGSNFHTEYGDNGVRAAAYQWNKDGKWTNICTDLSSTGTCTTNYATEMSANIKFRVIDSEGNISQETSDRLLRIDRTAPTCSLKVVSGTLGSNDWYVGNVTIGFNELRDNTSNIAEARSGVVFNQIRKGNDTYNSSSKTANLEATFTDESGYVTYYGFVEDQALNYGKCSIQVRKDSVAPTCSITGHSTLNCSDATSKLVKVYFGKENNATGGTSLNYLSSWNDTGTVNSAGTWYLKATDHAGKTTQVSATYYTITYNKNGGATNPNPASSIYKKDENANLSQVIRKGGSKMIGWNTTATATTALTSYKVTADATLYAVFQSCGNGYYTNDSGNGCTQCPEGKRYGGPGSSVSDCVDDNVKCNAGYYLKKGASSCTKCEKNYYCPGGTYAKKDGGGRKSCSSGYSSPAGSSKKTQCCKTVQSTEEVCLGEEIGGYCVEDHTVTGNGATCTSGGWGCTRGTSVHCYNGNIAANDGHCTNTTSPNHCDCRKIIGKTTVQTSSISCES